MAIDKVGVAITVIVAIIVATIGIIAMGPVADQLKTAQNCADERYGEDNWSMSDGEIIAIVPDDSDREIPIGKFVDQCEANQTIELNATGSINA